MMIMEGSGFMMIILKVMVDIMKVRGTMAVEKDLMIMEGEDIIIMLKIN